MINDREREGRLRLDGAMRCTVEVYLPEIALARSRILEARGLLAERDTSAADAVLEAEAARLGCLLDEPRAE